MGIKFNLKNTIALVAVLLIWGYVVKSKLGWFDSGDSDVMAPTSFSIAPIKNYAKDTFELNLNPRDPFLGGKQFVQNTNITTSNTNNISAPKNTNLGIDLKNLKTSLKWPKIKYFGYVSNRNKKNPACVIQIDSRTYNMHKGDENNGVILKSVYRDSIIVLFEE